jgi:glycosyl transferase, family 25
MLILILTCPAYEGSRLGAALDHAREVFGRHEITVAMGCNAGTPEAQAIYDAVANSRRLKRSLTPGEIAAYATHLRALRMFLDSSHDVAILLEDDFIAEDADALRRVADMGAEILPHRADMLKLYDFPRDRQLSRNHPLVTVQRGGVDLAKWPSPPAGAVGYLITRRGAEKLLRRKRIYRQIDEDLKYFWEFDLDIWSVSKTLVNERSLELGGSRLESERTGRPKASLARRILGLALTAERKLKNRWHMRAWLHGWKNTGNANDA